MSLSKALESEFGGTVPIRAGAPGSLTVYVDGKRVYSRKESAAPLPPAVIVQLVRDSSTPA